MNRSPFQKRMQDPVGLGDAKFFKDDRKSSGEPERDEPLEGVKQTQQVENCKDFNKLALGTQVQRRKPSPNAKIIGVMTYFTGFIFWLALYMAVTMDSGAAGLVVMLSFFGIHWCAIFSRVLSCGECKMGIYGLVCFYATLPLAIFIFSPS